MKHILIVEDNQLTAKGLQYLLEQANYRVFVAHSYASAMETLASERIDLAILDIGLGEASGYDLANNLRTNFSKTPFLFLTAKDSQDNVIHGLELGASDFVTKPFHSRELLLRVRNALSSSTVSAEQSIGNLHYNLEESKFFTVNPEGYAAELALTALERRILGRFLENPGQVVTRQNLLDEIYDASGKIVNDNTISVYLKRLRNKLAGIVAIRTVKNLGYQLEAIHEE